MAMESLGLMRPYLQLGQPWPWHCAPVARRDYVRHTLGETRGIRANSPDCADSKPAALVLGYLGSQYRFSAYTVAIVAFVRVGNLALNNMLAAGIELVA